MLMQALSVILVLTGTWFLAFGLRVKEGIDPSFRKTLGPALQEKIIPGDVSQRRVLFWIGLGLITIGAFLELWTILRT
jgi:hypothetical protein